MHSHGNFHTHTTPITRSRRASLRKRKPPTDSCPVPAPPHKMRNARAPTCKRRPPNAQPASDPTSHRTPDPPTPTDTPPAASPACLHPPHDAADAAAPKASGKRKASEGRDGAAHRVRPRPTGPDSLAPSSSPPQASGVTPTPDTPPSSSTPGRQGQKRVSALLPAIFAKSAKLAGRFAHLQ